MQKHLLYLLFSFLPFIPNSLSGNNHIENNPILQQSSRIQYSDSCLGNLIQFSLSNPIAGQFVAWYFDDPRSGINNKAVGNTSTHTFFNKGSYKVTAHINTSLGIDTLIRTIHIDSCQSKQNLMKQEKCAVEISKVITPNNDGKNDFLEIKSLCLFEKYELSVFNRWGNVVFKSTNPNEFWNGKNQQEDSPDGNYMYLLKYKFINMEETSKNGNILLMR